MNFKRIILFVVLVNLSCPSFLTPSISAQRRRASISRSAQATTARERANFALSNFNALAAAYRRDHEAFQPTESMLQKLTPPVVDLESRSPSALDAERRRLRDVISQLERTRTWLLPARSKTEWALLGTHARAQLLEIEERQVWQREPHRYAYIIAAGMDYLLRHPTASPDEKLQLFLRRGSETRRLLDEARTNLSAPPRVFTEAGIAEARLSARFFRDTVPQLFGRAGGAGMSASKRANFDQANKEIVSDLRDFAGWLERDLLPRSTGKLGTGADVLRRMLRTEEVETPLDELTRRGEAELRAVQERMRTVAEDVAPGRGLAGALDALRREHPAASGLIGEARAELDRVGVFLRGNSLFPIPERLTFAVSETPLYARVRYLSAPELAPSPAGSTHLRLLITPPDGGLNVTDANTHLAFFNRYTLPFIAINNALPGALPLLPLSKTYDPVALTASTPSRLIADGWAHYCEQALLDAGFGGNNPKYELAQLHLRQLNVCRYLTALALHSDRMGYEDAVKFFQRECNLDPALAARFALNTALDPFAPLAVIGKHEIEKLLTDARHRDRAEFRLREFHRSVLNAGSLPLSLLRARVFERTGDVENASQTDPTSGGANDGAVSDGAAASQRQNSEVDFTVLAIGAMSDYAGGRSMQLITDPQEYARLWHTLGGGNPPNVNFETRSVIIARQGRQPTGGYSIAVSGVQQAEDNLVVQVDEQKPDPRGIAAQIVTSPFVLFSVPRVSSGTVVRFADDVRAPKIGGERRVSPGVRRQPRTRGNRPARRQRRSGARL